MIPGNRDDKTPEDNVSESADVSDPDRPEQHLEATTPDPNSSASPIHLWRKLVAGGAFLLAIGALVLAISNLADGPDGAAISGVASNAPTTSIPIPTQSLGITFGEVRDAWNSVEREPLITRELTRTPEPGPLDSFFYHFPHTHLIGAYNDADDYVVALMVRTSLTNPTIDTIYLHLCQIASPYSPDCIENYFSKGLSGMSVSEFAASGLQTDWTHNDNEWRVAMVEDDMTIRVMAPAAD